MSVDKVLDIAKTITTIKVKLKESKETLTRTMLITPRHKSFNLTRLQWSSSSGEAEMILQLKEEFLISGKKSEKLQILVGFLKIWLIRKIQQNYKAANYMIQAALKLVLENGVLSNQNVKPGHMLISCNS
jgi:hypothetical protein